VSVGEEEGVLGKEVGWDEFVTVRTSQLVLAGELRVNESLSGDLCPRLPGTVSRRIREP